MYIWQFRLKMLHPWNPPSRVSRILWYLVIQIHIEHLILFEFVQRNLSFVIWWISRVQHFQWNLSYTKMTPVTCKWFLSHACWRDVTCMNESWHTFDEGRHVYMSWVHESAFIFWCTYTCRSPCHTHNASRLFPQRCVAHSLLTHIHLCMQVWTCACMCARVCNACVCVHVCVLNMYVLIIVYIYIYLYIYIYICIYMCKYIYIYIYIYI